MNAQVKALTQRQLREIVYHREHAQRYKDVHMAISYDVIEDERRRWWNAYWSMYTILLRQHLRGQQVLVVGCGFGEDALRLAKLGSIVHAVDLSPDLVAIAGEIAKRESVSVNFEQMAAEDLNYENDSFDCIVACDILHHVDVPRAFDEIVRVSKPGACFVMNEIYTHSAAERIRRSRVVDKWVYPRLVNMIYGYQQPYITEDEQKLSQEQVKQIARRLSQVRLDYFDFMRRRFFSSGFHLGAKVDRACLVMLKPIAPVLAGRVLLTGRIAK